MSQGRSNTQTQDKQGSIDKDSITILRDKGSEVVASVAAMREVAIRIEAAVLEFENKKLEVVEAIRLERNVAINQIAAARDGAIAAVNAAKGDGFYRAAQHNQSQPRPGQPVATAE